MDPWLHLVDTCWKLLEPCYQLAVSHLCVKVGYVCNLEENLVLLRRALDDLKAEKEDVLNRVKAGEIKGGQRLKTVARWLSQVETIETNTNQLIDVASNALDDTTQGASDGRLSTWKRGEEVFKKLTEVQRLSGKEFTEVTEDTSLPVVKVRTCDQTIGIDETLKEIWECLRKDENEILGIYGMGGIGKTTILTLINNKFLEFKNDYDVVIWVESCKDADADVRKIQDEIGVRLDICGNNWSTNRTTERAGEISRVLIGHMPRFVLLLDGLWKDVGLTAIGIPLRDERVKYKVVFTTRSKEVCSIMMANKDIEVPFLEENKALELFKLKARYDMSDDEISKIAEKVASKCGRLPLAIEVIGKAMSSTRTGARAWNHALTKLESCPSREVTENIYQVLRLSYDLLEKKDEKKDVTRCFQYCALFPKEYYIKQNELVEYWISESFIKGGREEAKDLADEVIDTLVGASLLRVDGCESNRKVHMHGMIREMVLFIVDKIPADGERFVVKTDAGLSQLPDVPDWTTVTKMSLFNNEIRSIGDNPEFPDKTNLVTLFLQNNKLVGEFLRVMSTLVVLDLSWNLQITELPKGILELVSLRLLNLSGTSIKYLPAGLEVLRQLIHLNLESTSNLRNISLISKLEKLLRQLIHLNLESTSNLRNISLISKLEKLQVLRFYNSFAALDCSLLRILEQLKGLEVLTVTVSEDSVLEEFLRSQRLAGMTEALYLKGLNVSFAAIGMLSRLQKLKMVYCNITESGTEYEGIIRRDDKYSPSTSSNQISPWFKGLSAVVIDSCIHLKDLTWLIYAEKLESLSVKSSPNMREVINKEKADRVGANPFKQLQVLRLHFLEELRSIYGDESGVRFPKLKLNKVDIQDCDNCRQLVMEL